MVFKILTKGSPIWCTTLKLWPKYTRVLLFFCEYCSSRRYIAYLIYLKFVWLRFFMYFRKRFSSSDVVRCCLLSCWPVNKGLLPRDDNFTIILFSQISYSGKRFDSVNKMQTPWCWKLKRFAKNCVKEWGKTQISMEIYFLEETSGSKSIQFKSLEQQLLIIQVFSTNHI